MQAHSANIRAYEYLLTRFYQNASPTPTLVFHTEVNTKHIEKLCITNPLDSFDAHAASTEPNGSNSQDGNDARSQDPSMARSMNEIFRVASTDPTLSAPMLSFLGLMHLRLALFSDVLEYQKRVSKFYANRNRVMAQANVKGGDTMDPEADSSPNDATKWGRAENVSKQLEKSLNAIDEKRRFALFVLVACITKCLVWNLI